MSEGYAVLCDTFPAEPTASHRYFTAKEFPSMNQHVPRQPHQPHQSYPNQNPYRQQQRHQPSGNGNQFRRNELLRRQHDLADEMDNLTAWEQALCAQFQVLSAMELRLHGQKGIAAFSIVLSGGRSMAEQSYHYQRMRLQQERFHLQQQWTACQTQKAAAMNKIQRVQFELSLC
jgi:hypothetical protein